jgi:hypothetical protein
MVERYLYQLMLDTDEAEYLLGLVAQDRAHRVGDLLGFLRAMRINHYLLIKDSTVTDRIEAKMVLLGGAIVDENPKKEG